MIIFIWIMFSLAPKSTLTKDNISLDSTAYLTERKCYQDSVIVFRDTVNATDTIHIYVKKEQTGILQTQLNVVNQTHEPVVFYVINSRGWFIGSMRADTVSVNGQTPVYIKADLNYVNTRESPEILRPSINIDIKGTLNGNYIKRISFMIHRQ